MKGMDHMCFIDASGIYARPKHMSPTVSKSSLFKLQHIELGDNDNTTDIIQDCHICIVVNCNKKRDNQDDRMLLLKCSSFFILLSLF